MFPSNMLNGYSVFCIFMAIQLRVPTTITSVDEVMMKMILQLKLLWQVQSSITLMLVLLVMMMAMLLLLLLMILKMTCNCLQHRCCTRRMCYEFPSNQRERGEFQKDLLRHMNVFRNQKKNKENARCFCAQLQHFKHFYVFNCSFVDEYSMDAAAEMQSLHMNAMIMSNDILTIVQYSKDNKVNV